MMNSVVEGPLAGINVLEVSQYIAGPFAGQQLADAGANVIKVEWPDWGDPMRNFASDKAPLYGANFLAFNRNKPSIELNLQTPEGVETFRALAARAARVPENSRPLRRPATGGRRRQCDQGGVARLGRSDAEFRQRQGAALWRQLSGVQPQQAQHRAQSPDARGG